MFSLLILFYSSVALGKRDWRTRRPCLVALYAALNVPLLVTAITLSVPRSSRCLAARRPSNRPHRTPPHPHPPTHPTPPTSAFLAGTSSDRLSRLQDLFMGFAGVLFLALALLLLASAAMLARLESYQAMNVFQFDRRVMAVVNLLLSLVFVSRGIFNLLSAANKVELTVSLDGSDDLSWGGFVLYAAWEFVPTVLLLVTIARPPSTALLFRRGSHAVDTAPGPLLMFDGVDATGGAAATHTSSEERYHPLDGRASYGTPAGAYSPAGFDSGSYRLESSDGDGLSDASRTPPDGGFLQDGALLPQDARHTGDVDADALHRSRHEAWARGATR